MRNSLLVGTALTLTAVVVSVVSGVLDLDLEPVVLLGVAAGAVIALSHDRTTLGRVTAFGIGLAAALVGYVARALALPDATSGRTVSVVIVLALVTFLAVVTRDRLPLWAGVLGAGVFAGAYDRVYTEAPAEMLATGTETLTVLLLAVAAGFLTGTATRPAAATASRTGHGPSSVGPGAAAPHRGRRRRRAGLAARFLISPQLTTSTQENPHMNTALTRTSRRALAGAGAVLLSVVLASPAVAATGGSDKVTDNGTDKGIDVVNTETVQTYTDASGEPQESRIYEQLQLTGKGQVEVANPAITDGIRNLDEFGGFDVVDGEQVVQMDLDGSKDLRTVSEYDGDLPLRVEAFYFLDGEEVEPSDIVGATGTLEVRYAVTNVTGRTQTVSVDDGQGGTVEREVSVSLPMVGSLTTVLPDSFRDVASEQANMAGDGRGNAKLSFTMTLVPPVGAESVTFGYTAEVEDAELPRASVTALPVNPLQSPTFKSAGDSYQGGAATGAELAAGAGLIDDNLLKLRDGAGDLLAGLIKLRDGADQLEDGLAGKAAPGSEKLADGAGELRDGLGKLDDGAGKLDAGAGELSAGSAKLDDGAGKLSDGASAAASGSRELTDGLAQISGGLDQLAGVEGLPKAQAGVVALQQGVAALQAGLGSADDPTSLIGGLTKLDGGLGQLEAGSGRLVGGLNELAGGLPQAKGGVDQVKGGLDTAIAQGGSLDKLIGGLSSLLTMDPCSTDPQCAGTVKALIDGAKQSKSDLTDASNGLAQVSGGLGSAITGLTGQILPGAQQLQAGITDAHSGAGELKLGAVKARGGLDQVSGGLDQLSVGLGAAVSGVFQLADGASAAQDGSGTLSDGLGRLDSGAGKLADGTGDLRDGAGRLADGAGQLSDGTGTASAGSEQLAAGAQELADGLIEAATGSGKLADGLGEAADGAPKLVDGAQRLSDEGTKKLVEAGEDTALTYGEMYAILEAGAERADAESMVVGAPEDSVGLAAYTFEIQGEDDTEQRNVLRALAALGLLGAAAGAAALRRRLV